MKSGHTIQAIIFLQNRSCDFYRNRNPFFNGKINFQTNRRLIKIHLKTIQQERL